MQQKLPFLLLIVALLITGIFVIQKTGILDKIFVPSDGWTLVKPPQQPVDNPTANATWNKIVAFEGQNWNQNRTDYNNLKIEIGSQFVNKLFDEKIKDNLLTRLELANISALNAAAQSFFTNSAKPQDLNPLYKELKNYFASKYQPNVQHMYEAANHFYAFTKIAANIQKELDGSLFDETVLSTLLADLDAASDKPDIQSNPYVGREKQAKRGQITDRIIAIHVPSLKTDIENYTGDREYNEPDYTNYISKLEALKKHRLIGAEGRVITVCDFLSSKLEAHRSAHVRYDVIMSRSKIVCDEVPEFLTFNYYISKCLQDTQSPTAPSPPEPIDTTNNE